jgi:hypothetical protein
MTEIEEVQVKRGRKPKYATEEERKEAKRISSRLSAQKTRPNHIKNLQKYYENNREHINERNREYKKKQREIIKEKLQRLEELEEKIKNIENCFNTNI